MSACCPRCGCDEVKTPSFTWWGGALGAHLLRHMKCRLCGFGFDARTGSCNRRAVVAYTVGMNGALCAILSIADALTR